MPDTDAADAAPVTILNVDDSEARRYALTRTLQRAGFRVREAGTGQAALDSVAAERPDLIVLDVQLPDINGFEVCRRIKADPDTASVAILHLSASFASSENRTEGLNSGADGYLTLPIESEELLATIRALLRLSRAEEAARVLASQWQTTFDAISDGVCLLDASGRLARCNRTFAALCERTPDELIGRSFGQVVGDLFGPTEATALVAASQADSRTVVEAALRDRAVRIAVDPVRGPIGAQAGAVCIFSDVTQARLALAALRESDERFRLLTENVTDYAILMLDTQGHVEMGSAGVARILGYTDADLLGRNVAAIFTPEDRAAGVPEDEMRKAAAHGRAEAVRRHLRQDGSCFWASGVMTSLRDESGALRGFVQLMRDATEQKRAEEKQTQALEKQSRIAETLQRSLLLAPPADKFPGLSLETLYEAALDEATIGGDFFDAFALRENRVALVVGDVSGKGLVAAARTAEVKYALRAFLHEFGSPGPALAHLNDFICEVHRLDPNDDELFIVTAVAVLDIRSGEAVFATAGAEPSLVLGPDNQVTPSANLGRPLGIAPGAVYEEDRHTLPPGSTLLIATDGITEARRGHEFLGWEGMAGLAQQAGAAAPLAQIGQAIVDGARAFTGGPLPDDACLLLARRLPDSAR